MNSDDVDVTIYSIKNHETIQIMELLEPLQKHEPITNHNFASDCNRLQMMKPWNHINLL